MKLHQHWLSLLLVLLAGTTVMTSSKAAQDNMQKVDSVLDRLEQKLIDQERRQLFIDQRSASGEDAKDKSSPVVQYDYEPSTIKPNLPKESSLNQFASTIDQIEDELESFGGEIENLKAQIERGTKRDARVEVSAHIAQPDLVSIRDLQVKIDNYPIYTMNRETGLWNPRGQIPVFAGPLAPGIHKVSFTARIHKTKGKNLPVDTNVYHVYRQTFEIEVSQGSFQKGYRIRVGDIQKQNLEAKAKIETYDI